MENPPDLWDGVLRRLGSDVPPIALNTWLQPLQAEVRDRALRLHCPSAFHRERVRSRFLAQIELHASEEYGRPTALPADWKKKNITAISSANAECVQ